MQERTERLNYTLENKALNAFFGAASFRVARAYLNPTPSTLKQHSIKFLLSQFKYLRRKIMTLADNHSEVDVYNLQAIEILERAGITEPSEQQIITIERLLRAA